MKELTTTRAPFPRAISLVRSVEPESKTTTSSLPAALARQAGRLRSSFKVRMTTENIVTGLSRYLTLVQLSESDRAEKAQPKRQRDCGIAEGKLNQRVKDDCPASEQ